MKAAFIENSRQGRNKWYLSLVLLITCYLFIGLLNLPLNKYVIPFLRQLLGSANVAEENLYSLVTGIYFWLLILFIYFVFPKIHQRSFFSLINANDSKFRWRAFVQGFFVWGILALGVNLLGYKDVIGYKSLQDFTAILAVNIIFFSAQTFLEELIFRGYLIQIVGRIVQSSMLVNFIVSICFGVLHIAFGLQSLLSSFLFSLVVNALVLQEEGLERAYGIHFVNNLLLATFFANISEHIGQNFSTHINWTELLIEVGSLCVLLFASIYLISNKSISWFRIRAR